MSDLTKPEPSFIEDPNITFPRKDWKQSAMSLQFYLLRFSMDLKNICIIFEGKDNVVKHLISSVNNLLSSDSSSLNY